MLKLNSKWLVAAALATALVAGCGGGDSDGAQTPPTNSATNPSTSAKSVVDYLLALIANEKTDLSEPKATDGISFATEETAEPSAI
jgi:hypothetical protein